MFLQLVDFSFASNWLDALDVDIDLDAAVSLGELEAVAEEVQKDLHKPSGVSLDLLEQVHVLLAVN